MNEASKNYSHVAVSKDGSLLKTPEGKIQGTVYPSDWDAYLYLGVKVFYFAEISQPEIWSLINSDDLRILFGQIAYGR